MLTVSELKHRLGIILGIEENRDHVDWFAIRNLSVELLQELSESAPRIVREYLTDSDIRRVSRGFANAQHLELLHFLRSSDDGVELPEE